MATFIGTPAKSESVLFEQLRALGFNEEFQGGGCFMFSAYRGEAFVGITYSDGADLPSPDEWLIAVSPEPLADSVAHWRSDEGGRDIVTSAKLALACAEALADDAAVQVEG
jgi:hypothetical protein